MLLKFIKGLKSIKQIKLKDVTYIIIFNHYFIFTEYHIVHIPPRKTTKWKGWIIKGNNYE